MKYTLRPPSSCSGSRRPRRRRHGAVLCAVLAAAWLASPGAGRVHAQPAHDVADPQGRFTLTLPAGWVAQNDRAGIARDSPVFLKIIRTVRFSASHARVPRST